MSTRTRTLPLVALPLLLVVTGATAQQLDLQSPTPDTSRDRSHLRQRRRALGPSRPSSISIRIDRQSRISPASSSLSRKTPRRVGRASPDGPRRTRRPVRAAPLIRTIRDGPASASRSNGVDRRRSGRAPRPGRGDRPWSPGASPPGPACGPGAVVVAIAAPERAEPRQEPAPLAGDVAAASASSRSARGARTRPPRYGLPRALEDLRLGRRRQAGPLEAACRARS